MLSEKIAYSPRVDLGHIIQAAILFVTIGGGGIGCYVTLESRITAQAERLASIEQRISGHDNQIAQMRIDWVKSMDAIQGSLTRVEGQLADLRVLEAGRVNRVR